MAGLFDDLHQEVNKVNNVEDTKFIVTLITYIC